ncbi:diguanylate cyclase [Marinicella sediminis]|uniref:diguanylate cyclase n=1 Tax=Marinicella sediminis TaxID=1792834 RepID=A0ABV7J9W0_9GAMM|nr:diguanylate cyclase [Marinicella sediminis]
MGDRLTSLVVVVIAGAAAAVVNLFRLPLFFEAEFLFGQFLVLLVAVYRGPLAGLACAVIATWPLVDAWGSYWATLTFGMEALFVGLACRFVRFNVIMLVMIYWIAIGMPVSWYSISGYEHFLDSHRTAILIKQLTNAIVYAHITALVMYLPVTRKLLGFDQKPVTLSIKEQSSHIISSLLITCGIGFFFFNLDQSIKNSGSDYSQVHDIKHEQLKAQLGEVFSRKITAFSEYRETLAQLWNDPEMRQQSLLSFNQRYPQFRTMVITDQHGDLLHSSPEELVKNVKSQNENINVADRDYFTHAISSDQTYVSPAFVGRGFGKDLIVAISSGVPDLLNRPSNVGIIEGSFILTNLRHVKSLLDNIDPSVEAILIDQNGQVVLASEQLQLPPLQTFELVKGVDTFYEHSLVTIKKTGGEPGREVYYLAESLFPWGWKLLSLQNEARFADVIERSLIIFAVTIVLVVLISHILAFAISHSWSYHMTRLNELIERGDEFNRELDEFENNDQLPDEIVNLYQEIKNSRQAIVKMNTELQNTVAERTEKLQIVNAKLNKMASTDALTGLDNRRQFNQKLDEMWQHSQKNLSPLSMLIIDIDYFKKINDTFGHPVGDQVLVQLAEQLQHFNDDRIGCLARLGGEEFCLLMSGQEHTDVISLAERIRKHIEEYAFKIGSGKPFELTISVGVATINPTRFTASKLYQLADNALYEAKHSGRNQVRYSHLD